MLNFTNPEARVLHAINHLTKVKAAGICHGIFGAISLIMNYTALKEEEMLIHSAGMNHFYCILKAVEKSSGRDLLPGLIAEAIQDGKAPPLFRKLAEIFGVFTFPSDDHIGEYLSYGHEFCGDKWHLGRENHPVHVQEHDDSRWLEPFARGEKQLDDNVLRPSGEITVPIIVDIALNRNSFRDAVNVLNSEGYINNLPRTAAIEVPAMVDARGIHPIHVGDVPETFACYMRTQFSIHELVTEAYRVRSKKLLLQALLMDPCVNSIAGAQKIMDDMFYLQAEFLPEF
jgi:alpha-galactosidase